MSDHGGADGRESSGGPEDRPVPGPLARHRLLRLRQGPRGRRRQRLVAARDHDRVAASAAEEIQRDATEKLRSLPGVYAVTIRLDLKPPAPAAAPRGAPAPPAADADPAGRPLQDRRRVGQGRRRQVDRRREPRPRPRAPRPPRRPHGLRHLRPLAADDDGHRREALRQRGEPDRPDRALRREGHVARVSSWTSTSPSSGAARWS